MKIGLNRGLLVEAILGAVGFSLFLYLVFGFRSGDFGYFSVAAAFGFGCFFLIIKTANSFTKSLQGVSSKPWRYLIRYLSWLLGPVFFMSLFLAIPFFAFDGRTMSMGDLSHGLTLGLILVSVVMTWDFSYLLFLLSFPQSRAKRYSYSVLIALFLPAFIVMSQTVFGFLLPDLRPFTANRVMGLVALTGGVFLVVLVLLFLLDLLNLVVERLSKTKLRKIVERQD